MLRAYASAYILIGSSFAHIKRDMEAEPQVWRIFNKGSRESLVSTFQSIEKHCKALRLPVAEKMIQELCSDIESGEVGGTELPIRIDGLERCLRIELGTRLFLIIPSDRSDFWVSPRHGECGSEVEPILELITDSFGDAAYDLREAANCFACERYTASVYHQMRVAEFGLVAVADSVALAEEQKFSWEKMLQGIQKHIKTIESTKPSGWDADRKKYSDLCTWFTNIKTGWRNPASHVPRIYEEPTARAMFSTLRGLFEHLKGYGIAQVQMPRAIAKPDEEDHQA